MSRFPLTSALLGLILAGSTAKADPYRLPWQPATRMELTQDCNDSHYADHVGTSGFAWDFANGTRFLVSAARGGTVTHLKTSSRSGCSTAACVDWANYIVVDHGDGTQSVYLHIEGDSLAPNVRCGKPVVQGQLLARAGSTGWSTGPHLHFQVNSVVRTDALNCECGDDGQACADDHAAWASFWSGPGHPALRVAFDEWDAGSCNDRRIVLPSSQNAEPGQEPTRLVDARTGLPTTSSSLDSPPATRSPEPQRSPDATDTRPADGASGVGGRVSGKAARPRLETPSPSRRAPSQLPARPRRPPHAQRSEPPQ